MVHLTMTAVMVQALEQLRGYKLLPETSDDLPLDEPALGKPISHAQIIGVARQLKQVHEDEHFAKSEHLVSYHLDNLLRGSQVYIEPPKPKKEPVITLYSTSVQTAANKQ